MRLSFLLFFLFSIFACQQGYTPKPKGFFKLALPEKTYKELELDCGYSFLYPDYAKAELLDGCMLNLNFPYFSGTLHITYSSLDNNLYEHIEQSRDLAYKHNTRADAISEQAYINNENRVYGLLYDYDGLTATSTQFYLTDSVNHFFRGALYFNTEINDSILPVNNFLKKDIRYLIETLRWKDSLIEKQQVVL